MIIHQCISGFTQNEGYFHGVMKLSERLHETGIDDGFNHRVILNRWNSDWKKIAEYYWLLAEYYIEPISLCIYAYSWGAGWGAMQLAKHLSNSRIQIRVMVLSDPVYRHKNYLMRLLNIPIFDPIIKVPHNVKEVFSFKQRTNWPRGHRLIADNGTVIHPTVVIENCTHQKMDDSWLFHALCLEVASRINKGLDLDDIDPLLLDINDYIQ
jgi:hypothetical protein